MNANRLDDDGEIGTDTGGLDVDEVVDELVVRCRIVLDRLAEDLKPCSSE